MPFAAQDRAQRHRGRAHDPRKKAQTELAGLLKKRSAFIAKKTAELKKAGKLEGFDAQVQDLIREQAAPKGIAY